MVCIKLLKQNFQLIKSEKSLVAKRDIEVVKQYKDRDTFRAMSVI